MTLQVITLGIARRRRAAGESRQGLALALLLSSRPARASDCIAQRFAGLKRRDATGGNDQFLPGFRVAPFATLSLANDEAAKWDQLHFLSLVQGVFDRVEHQVDNFTNLTL